MMKSLIRCVSLAALALFAAVPARAETVKLEAAGIQFDLPAGWTSAAEGDNAIRVKNADGSVQVVLTVADKDSIEDAAGHVADEVDKLRGAYMKIQKKRSHLACVLIATHLTIPLMSSTQLAQTLSLPSGLTYVWWKFGVSEFEDFQIDITIHNDIGTKPGLYFQMYQGQIGDIGFYFGLQTDVFKPQSGGSGKGLIFSRWKTRDLANTRPVSDGWNQSSGMEGDFVGIRRKYAWTNHKYRVRLTKVDEDTIGVWYGLFILDYETRTEDYIGALRFPKQGKSAKIKDGGGTWTEVYSGASQVSDLPRWHISIDGCYVNNRTTRAIEAYSDYSSIPNTDIYVDANSHIIHHLIGDGVIRQHPKGRLF